MRFSTCWRKNSARLLLFWLTAAASPGADTIRAAIQAVPDRKPAPVFQLQNAAGKTVKLSDYRGKVVLLDFWATECGGCKLEIPWFMEIDKAYRGKGLATVGVSVDILYEDLKSASEAWSRVTPFIKSQKVNYDILMGDNAATTQYHIEALPATYLIDREGRIAATYIGLVDRENVEANVKALLAAGKP